MLCGYHCLGELEAHELVFGERVDGPALSLSASGLLVKSLPFSSLGTNLPFGPFSMKYMPISVDDSRSVGVSTSSTKSLRHTGRVGKILGEFTSV